MLVAATRSPTLSGRARAGRTLVVTSADLTAPRPSRSLTVLFLIPNSHLSLDSTDVAYF